MMQVEAMQDEAFFSGFVPPKADERRILGSERAPAWYWEEVSQQGSLCVAYVSMSRVQCGVVYSDAEMGRRATADTPILLPLSPSWPCVLFLIRRSP